jgi:hypothetical protein
MLAISQLEPEGKKQTDVAVMMAIIFGGLLGYVGCLKLNEWSNHIYAAFDSEYICEPYTFW